METKSTITSGIQFNNLEKSKDLAISEQSSTLFQCEGVINDVLEAVERVVTETFGKEDSDTICARFCDAHLEMREALYELIGKVMNSRRLDLDCKAV